MMMMVVVEKRSIDIKNTLKINKIRHYKNIKQNVTVNAPSE